METGLILMWTGYAVFATVTFVLIGYKCWNYCRKHLGYDTAQGMETMLPSSTTASNSFTYIPSPKSNYIIPPGIIDGLSELDNNIMFDQPMILSCANPFCRQKAVAGFTSDEDYRGRYPSSTTCATCRANEQFAIEDDQQSIHYLMNSFSKSVLSLNSSEEYDKEYCEGPTILLNDHSISIDEPKIDKKSETYSGFSRDVKSRSSDNRRTANVHPNVHMANVWHRNNQIALPPHFYSCYVSDIL